MKLETKIYYVSLVKGLLGYYVKFIAPDEDIVRMHCAEYFGRLWCSVYDANRISNIRGSFKCINEDNPIDLSSGWQWE